MVCIFCVSKYEKRIFKFYIIGKERNKNLHNYWIYEQAFAYLYDRHCICYNIWNQSLLNFNLYLFNYDRKNTNLYIILLTFNCRYWFYSCPHVAMACNLPTWSRQSYGGGQKATKAWKQVT